MNAREHYWDEIRACQTVLESDFAKRALASGSKGFHESLFRSFAILGEVETLIARGDSAETVATFIEWAKSK